MKHRPRAKKPKDTEWPLLTISGELRSAARDLSNAVTNCGDFRALCEGGPLMAIEFLEPEGSNQGLEVLQLIEAGAPERLRWFIRRQRESVMEIWRNVVSIPWFFTGKEIYDAKSLLMKVARKQGAVSAFLHESLFSNFPSDDMDWETLTPSPTASPMSDRDAYILNEKRARMIADPKTAPGIHPLVELLNQNISSTCLSLPQEAIAYIELRPGTERLLEKKPKKPLELAQLNRLLLEDAYSSELARYGAAGVPGSGSGLQKVPCSTAFTDPDLLKFDRTADQLEKDFSMLLSSLEDEETSLSMEEIAQRLREIRGRGRELSKSAKSIFTTPSPLSQRINNVVGWGRKPCVLFRQSVFEVVKDNPLLLHDVPFNIFLEGPIPKLCDTLVALNTGLSQIPVPPHAFRTIQNIQFLFRDCYPLKFSFLPGQRDTFDACCLNKDEMVTFERILQQCVESLRDFVTLALSDPATVNPGSPVVVAAAKTSPAPATVATKGPAPDKTSVPKPDPQSFTVKIDRVGGTRKPVLANTSVQLKGPTDEEWQSCKGASKQTLLALFVILGKDGKGKVPRTRFVELCFAPVKGAVLAAQVDHMFENRCGGNSSLKEQYDLHLVNEGTGRKTNEITGPHFETNLTQDDVEQHLKGGPKTPCGAKRSR